MDYIPVYEGAEPDISKTVRLTSKKIARTGIRTAIAEARVIVEPLRAFGTVKYDERKLAVVTVSADGYIEELYADTPGQTVRAGQPLARIYSSNYLALQVEAARRDPTHNRQGRDQHPRDQKTGQAPVPSQDAGMLAKDQGGDGLPFLAGGDSMGLPRLYETQTKDPYYRGIAAGAQNMTSADWPAPVSGTIVEKKALKGQRVGQGEELYRIADLSAMWVIAEVGETDLPKIKSGTGVSITARAYPDETAEGKILFIYPDVRPDTRTGRVCIEVPNRDGHLKAEMYVDVVFRHGADGIPVIAVPDSAIIDSGTHQTVFAAVGEGGFEPREVKPGSRGGGYTEIISGVSEGEMIVTSANFLIDAESNLNAALAAMSREEPAR